MDTTRLTSEQIVAAMEKVMPIPPAAPDVPARTLSVYEETADEATRRERDVDPAWWIELIDDKVRRLAALGWENFTGTPIVPYNPIPEPDDDWDADNIWRMAVALSPHVTLRKDA